VSVEPRGEDFPDRDSYLLAWYTWRAIQRDARFNSEELAAYYDTKEARVRQLFAQPTA
jgi:hypothetical protein